MKNRWAIDRDATGWGLVAAVLVLGVGVVFAVQWIPAGGWEAAFVIAWLIVGVFQLAYAIRRYVLAGRD